MSAAQPPSPAHTVGGACQPPMKKGGFKEGSVWCCPTCKGLWYVVDHSWEFLTGSFRDAVPATEWVQTAKVFDDWYLPVPRVASSVEDLRVGQVVACAYHDQYGIFDLTVVEDGRVEGLDKDVTKQNRNWSFGATLIGEWGLVILSDPTPLVPEWIVPATEMETLREALVAMDGMKCGHWAAIRAARAVLDSAKEVQRDE